MRPLADLGHSAYDTLEFIKEHYPEMVQMYETIMAHLKVPEGSESSSSEVITDAFTPETYQIADNFDSIILDPDIITALGYTMDECNIIAKRAGFIYLGLYNRTFTYWIETDNGFGPETVTVQAPQFALVKPRYEGDDWGYHLFDIPKAHSLDRVSFYTETGCGVSTDGDESSTNIIYDFAIIDIGDGNGSYYQNNEHQYTSHMQILHNAPELQFNILIGLGDDIKLPEVL